MTDAWGNDRTSDETAIPGWTADRMPDGGTTEPEVETKVAEIEQTRGEMSQTVSAIGDKLDPANIAQGAKDATIGKVEQTVRSVQNAAEDFVAQPMTSMQQAGGGLIETIRSNPVPAALAGIGIGWLWMSRSGGTRNGSRYGNRYQYAGGSYQGYGGTGHDAGYGSAWTGQAGSTGMPSGSQGITSQVGNTVSGVTDTVGQTVGQVTGTVGQTVGQVAGTVGQTAGQVGQTMGQVPVQAQGLARQLGNTVSQNPLGFGVVSLAVGTALGLALPATSTEQRVLGQASTKVIDQAESAASQGMQQLRDSAQQS